jgi:hypothetical protein
MPVTWHGPEPELGCGLPQIISDSVFILMLVATVFPEGEFDADLQQVDSRKPTAGV